MNVIAYASPLIPDITDTTTEDCPKEWIIEP